MKGRLRAMLTLLFLVAGAGSAPAAEPVELGIEAEVAGDTLEVEGTANVPDGALVVYAAYHAADPRIRARGIAEVTDGRYAATIHIADWPSGKIEVAAHFQMLLPGRSQPQAVLARYGPKGERMTGAKVVTGGDGSHVAVASATATKP